MTALDTIRTVVREAGREDLLGEAAKIAYYFFLSLFPLVLVLFALTGLIGGDSTFQRLSGFAETMVPRYGWQFVRGLIEEVTGRDRPGLLSFGVLLTFWAASNGIVALTNQLNDIYGVVERRPWWRRRVLALGVLMSGVVLLVISTAALVPSIGWLREIGLGPTWNAIRWLLGLMLPAAAAWLAYRILPARDQRGSTRETITGAVVATAVWTAATLLLRLYLANFSSYDRTYGAVGAVIALLVWFQMSAVSVLLGGKVAAVLERERSG